MAMLNYQRVYFLDLPCNISLKDLNPIVEISFPRHRQACARHRRLPQVTKEHHSAAVAADDSGGPGSQEGLVGYPLVI